MEGFGEVVERLRRSTVQVAAGRQGSGSGCIVKPEGVIATNAHVVTQEPIQVQLWDGTRLPARLMIRDRQRDLALLQVAAGGLPAAGLADSGRLRVGELVMAVGNPLGFFGALTTGVVHALGRVRGLGPQAWVQAALRLAPGNSGGPLANAAGAVVGINTMVAGGVGLAVPSNVLARLLTGAAAPAGLGLLTRAVEVVVAGKQRRARLVLAVAEGSAAERAALMLGDILIGVEGPGPEVLERLDAALGIGAGVGAGVVRVQFLRGDRTRVRVASVSLEAAATAAA